MKRYIKFYHGTSSKNWDKIKKDGFLWGYRIHRGKPTLNYRYTYLTPDLETAKKYGEIILEIDYIPGSMLDNYELASRQFSVFEPIDIIKIKKIN